VLRELAVVLSERFEAREKARSRAATLRLEAAILALSPIVLPVLIGAASPAYLDADRTPSGTLKAPVEPVHPLERLASPRTESGVEFADRIVVLRHGRAVADIPRAEATAESLVSLIVGFEQGLEPATTERAR
jgi:hypothetical protein